MALFAIFLRLGLTSFGGPVAHLGYFHDEFVKRRKWLSDAAYADMVAFCQVLPGPASSQVGLSLGYARAGIVGALLAWSGFTLPSAVALTVFALGLERFHVVPQSGWLHGLKLAAIAVVAQAVWSMGQRLCPDLKRRLLAFLAAAAALLLPQWWMQIVVILLSGAAGLMLLSQDREMPHAPLIENVNRRMAGISLFLFFAVLLCTPWISSLAEPGRLFASFYRTGALVFGGGHVVLPLLHAEVVEPGLVRPEIFLAGYGVAQAVPGPLFSFAAYLGALIAPGGWAGAALALGAIYLPSFFLIFGLLPFWENLRRSRRMRAALLGINAGVVGLLTAAVVEAARAGALTSWLDFALAGAGFVLLMWSRLPAWAFVVLMSAVCAAIG